MRGFWMLVHVLGFTLWLGGGIATMVAGVTAKRLGAAERLAGYKLIGAVQRILVAPGAIAVVLSGLILSMPYMKQGVVPGWLGLMMIAASRTHGASCRRRFTGSEKGRSGRRRSRGRSG